MYLTKIHPESGLSFFGKPHSESQCPIAQWLEEVFVWDDWQVFANSYNVRVRHRYDAGKGFYISCWNNYETMLSVRRFIEWFDNDYYPDFGNDD